MDDYWKKREARNFDLSSADATRRFDYGDLFTVEEYLDYVKGGMFVDYDGHGYAVYMHSEKVGIVDNKRYIYPSQGDEAIPPTTTHILWFNK